MGLAPGAHKINLAVSFHLVCMSFCQNAKIVDLMNGNTNKTHDIKEVSICKSKFIRCIIAVCLRGAVFFTLIFLNLIQTVMCRLM